MSDDKMTPGPWAIFNTGTINQIVPAMRPGLVADLIDNEANARLIAQAPDLLAACQLLMEIVEDEDVPVPWWRKTVIARAKMTIRIAEGGGINGGRNDE